MLHKAICSIEDRKKLANHVSQEFNPYREMPRIQYQIRYKCIYWWIKERKKRTKGMSSREFVIASTSCIRRKKPHKIMPLLGVLIVSSVIFSWQTGKKR
jgi:hypothetical protein